MPRGGARPGAGRKPGSRKAVVLGMDGARFDPATLPPAPPEVSDLLEPPVDMLAAQKTYWRLWAPLAVAQRTLTVATMPGFREACELAVLKKAIERRVQKVGPASSEAQALLRNYLKLSQRLDAALARFKLTAMGKPETAAPTKKATANPWAQAAAQ